MTHKVFQIGAILICLAEAVLLSACTQTAKGWVSHCSPGPRAEARAGANDDRNGAELNPMRWLIVALFVSVIALVAASAGMALHIWRERGRQRELRWETGMAEEAETEEAP